MPCSLNDDPSSHQEIRHRVCFIADVYYQSFYSTVVPKPIASF